MKTAKQLVPARKGVRKKRSPERWNGAIMILIVIMAAGYISYEPAAIKALKALPP